MRTRTRLRQVERGLSKRSEFSATTALTREAQRNDLKAMLIYLNAAIESWKTANDRFSDAGLSRATTPLAVSHYGTIARWVTVAVTVYLLVLVAAFTGIVIWVFSRKRKSRFEAEARIPLDEDKDSPP